jgi:hypothetical protein
MYEGQRPPPGDWRTWLLLMGRGSGKTEAACRWVQHQVETGRAKRVALLAPTWKDARTVIVEGPSGMLAVAPPWCRPKYYRSLRELHWPNGAVGFTYSAEEPESLRGPQHDLAYADEIARYRGPAAMDNLLLGLRLGADPRLCVSTTPRPVQWLSELIGDPTTAVTRGTTYDNRSHLAPSFYDRIVTKFEGTRLGQQELLGLLLGVSEGVWFRAFDPARHVTAAAEYDPTLPVHLAIDAGVSDHHAAVWYQVRSILDPAVRSPTGWVISEDPRRRDRVTVFGDYHSQGLSSAQAARAIHQHGLSLPSAGRLESVRLDPYGLPSTGAGITAFHEFVRVFGSLTDRWPKHRVLDGLDQLEVLLESMCLLIHPRCELLTSAFQSYSRIQLRSGEWINEPKDPQHPHEDLMDALRGGIRTQFPEGRVEQPDLRTVRGF